MCNNVIQFFIFENYMHGNFVRWCSKVPYKNQTDSILKDIAWRNHALVSTLNWETVLSTLPELLLCIAIMGTTGGWHGYLST